MPLYEEIIAPTPAGRFGTPEECAGTAIYLASQASDFVTGTTLFLDGSSPSDKCTQMIGPIIPSHSFSQVKSHSNISRLH
jgi:Enoyl-(Acyl carrier protein) reductase